ncbi:MAG: flagellar motor switch protein FliG [Oscillospiraceae bacterium]|jgi:flagellar motor switch protein FliG|nr:flagellar motor switch protein FliG [Oscillospiraceae bacterium]
MDPMTSIQKAALIISSIGAENASNVFKNFTEDEIEKITFEIAKMDYWPIETVEEVLNEFYELCLTQKVVSEGGMDYAREVLEKAFGDDQASFLLSKIGKQLKTRSFEFIRKSDYKNLLAIVQNEHPQTIALILSYARTDQSSAILSELSKELRVDVVERIARMETASPDVLRTLEERLEAKFATLANSSGVELGGINFVAEIMNNIDRATETDIFDSISSRDPKLAEEIRKKMFVFEDIALLDSVAIQTILRDVDPKDLAMSIKGTQQEVAEAVYSNMSSRMRETTQQEVEYLHNIRMRDVEEAQQRIVAIVRKLEEEGTITVSKGGGGNEVIA